jgi:hypothetical protein
VNEVLGYPASNNKDKEEATGFGNAAMTDPREAKEEEATGFGNAVMTDPETTDFGNKSTTAKTDPTTAPWPCSHGEARRTSESINAFASTSAKTNGKRKADSLVPDLLKSMLEKCPTP